MGHLQKCTFPEEGWVLMRREQLCVHGTAKTPRGWSQEGKHQGRRHWGQRAGRGPDHAGPQLWFSLPGTWTAIAQIT